MDPGAAGLDAFGSPLFPAAPGGRASGAFKSPDLRNVELTGPYFHTGGAATLEQVLEFYARNGDVPAGGNLGPGIGNIRLNQQDRTSIVEFLKALTDDRVRYERPPFDHPSLCIPVGYAENPAGVLTAQPAPSGTASAAADLWSLVRTEFAILECLMRASGRLVARDTLIEEVWGQREVTYNNLEVFIKFLRAKLDSPGSSSLIHSERGLGYRLRSPEL